MNTNSFPAEGFTKKARNALTCAARCAGRLGHTYISTEHLLCGFLEEGGCTACVILEESGLTLEAGGAHRRRFRKRHPLPHRAFGHQFRGEAGAGLGSGHRSLLRERTDRLGAHSGSYPPGDRLRRGTAAALLRGEPYQALRPLHQRGQGALRAKPPETEKSGEVRQRAYPPLGLRGL